MGNGKVHLSDVVAKSPIQWPKKAVDWEEAVRGAEIVYEDHHVVAFHETEDDPQESAREAGEVRITLMPKRHVQSLADLSVADEELNAALLFGIQQVAYKLDLQNKGFEVRAHVLPPYQHRPGLVYKIRSGKPPKKTDDAAG
jgi:diadenosine tetraphosphate (Ap4A) HIT family hydrolase